jgi:Spy/CpxP family protein refolding chaperone
MKKNTLIGIIVALALALITSSAVAWNPGYGRGAGYGSGYGNPPVSNLMPEQATKIQTIRQAIFKEIAILRQRLFGKKMEMRGLWLSQNPDQAKINSLQKDIIIIHGQLQEKSTNAKFEMRKVLTPEQQVELSLYGPGMGYGKDKMGGHMARW